MSGLRMATKAICVLAGIGVYSAAAAKEWPQWCGTDCKNMVADEKGLPDTFVPGKKDPQGKGIDLATTRNVQWVARTGTSNSLSTPAVAGGKLFFGANDHNQGVFKCLDARTGRLLWKYTAPHRNVPRRMEGCNLPFNFAHFAAELGICSSPAVDGNRVYFVNHRCEVVCLDIDAAPAAGAPPAADVPDAKVAWVFDMWETTGVRPSDACDGSPLIVGDLLYVCTSNGVDREASVPYADNRKTPAPNAPNLIVLAKKTGRLVATDDAAHIGPNIMHGQWSSPSRGMVSGRQLILFGGGDGVCYALEALGQAPERPVKLKTVWSFDCNPPEYKDCGGLDWATRYSLGDKRLKQSLNKKNEAGFVGMSEIIGTPVFYKNRVYVAIGRDPEHGRGRGALWCIDAGKTGDITRTGCIWSYQGLDRTLSTASIAGGLLYIADVAGRIHCLDAESGQLRWVYETKETVWGSTLVADGKIYLPTQKYLHVLQAGREIKPLARISLGAPMWASAVAADGTLYVASTRYLWAVRQAK
ncbi:MAG: PQQ-binding-like beta-propeller repeat protein [Thermoguttaceae bacterium]